MDKNSILEFNNKESVSDVLNELLRSGAQKLIHNAVEVCIKEKRVFSETVCLQRFLRISNI
jgi:histone H3/H4